MEIRTTPVATAVVVERFKLRNVGDVVRAPLINVTTFPLAWPLWLREAGAGEVKPKQAVWVDGFGAALQAAEQGAGVALGLEPLFAARERAGALCRPFAFCHPTGGYWLVHRTTDGAHPGLRAFRRWLLAELANDS